MRKQNRRLASTIALFAALLGSGCATSWEYTDHPSSNPGDPLRLPSTKAIGTVTLVDLSESIALVELYSAGEKAAGILTTRNSGLQETAQLETTTFRSGRTLGTTILSGTPHLGDEVTLHR